MMHALPRYILVYFLLPLSGLGAIQIPKQKLSPSAQSAHSLQFDTEVASLPPKSPPGKQIYRYSLGISFQLIHPTNQRLNRTDYYTFSYRYSELKTIDILGRFYFSSEKNSYHFGAIYREQFFIILSNTIVKWGAGFVTELEKFHHCSLQTKINLFPLIGIHFIPFENKMMEVFIDLSPLLSLMFHPLHSTCHITPLGGQLWSGIQLWLP